MISAVPSISGTASISHSNVNVCPTSCSCGAFMVTNGGGTKSEIRMRNQMIDRNLVISIYLVVGIIVK